MADERFGQQLQLLKTRLKLHDCSGVIQAREICKTYGSKSNAVSALENLSLDVATGERVAIVGRSGSGKTTLLNILSGLDRPTTGELVVDGQEIAKFSASQMADYRLNSVGVVFQSFQLIAQRTAAQNVELPLIISGTATRERKRLVEVALAKVGLDHRAGHFPYQLSGGEQQRVAIARAIIKRPSVLLADEPTGNLDSNTATNIMDLLVSVSNQESLTMLLITHDLKLAADYSQRQYMMKDGKLSQMDGAESRDVLDSVRQTS